MSHHLKKDLELIEELQQHTMMVVWLLSQRKTERSKDLIADIVRKQATTLGLCLAMTTDDENVLLHNVTVVANEMIESAHAVWERAAEELSLEAIQKAMSSSTPK